MVGRPERTLVEVVYLCSVQKSWAIFQTTICKMTKWQDRYEIGLFKKEPGSQRPAATGVPIERRTHEMLVCRNLKLGRRG